MCIWLYCLKLFCKFLMDNFLLICVIVFIPFAYAGFSYAPWAPTRKSDIDRIITLMKGKNNIVFYELWCWDWRTSFQIAKKFDIKVIWIEINPYLYFLCQAKKILSWQKNITFLRKNLFNINLKDADIIYTFWMPEKMIKLWEKIKKECKTGTQIISYTFAIIWLENEIKHKPSSKELSIYTYEI